MGKVPIAHDMLKIERWPTRDEASRMRWFSPIQVGPVTLRDRTWVPAMVPWRASDTGEVTDAVLGWYRRFAAGQPGALVIEATGIRDIPSGPLLRIGHDRYVSGLARLVQTIREASDGYTRVFIQLIDFLSVRRRPTKEKFFGQHMVIDGGLRERLADVSGATRWLSANEREIRDFLMVSSDDIIGRALSVRQLRDYHYGYREQVSDVHLDAIASLPAALPRLFADAAARAKQAGFDGIELHYAHAYTMASFLSATNKRTDGYGGSREGRVRLPLEVYTAVRRTVGEDFVVGCRFLGDEVIPEGSHLGDATYFGEQFAAAGMDFLSISKGGKFDDAKQPRVGEAVYPYTGPSGAECMPTVHIGAPGPFGRNVELAAAIRRAVRARGFETPVVTAGGIGSPWQAEEILQNEHADIVAAARQSLADPDWFRKIRLGQGVTVRRCIFTNYCESLDQRHKEVTCQLWDRIEEPGERVALSSDGRRRLTAPLWREE